MNIADKIEEIRQKPEHIRIRYVWLSVAATMALILIIWIFSLKANFGKDQNNISLPQIPELPTSLGNNNAPTAVPQNNEGFGLDFGNAANPGIDNQTDNSSQ